uniref:F-box/WD repeat-containing protein 9 n=1 Tax=Lygus hesperus TaxID=30085 RepID=A0A0A9ZF69_LYGHE
MGTWCNLPTEILIQIFDYLEPVFLLKTVALVCERFKSIISDGDYYRLCYYQAVWSRFPLIEDVPMLRHKGKISCPELKELGKRLEEVCKRWSSPKPVQKFYSSYGTVVDAVHILKNTSICAVGTRHKCVDLWDVRDAPRVVSTMASAHNGWVSCLDSYEPETFFSGGWDSVVTVWKVREHSCEHLWSTRCRRGVMSIASRPDIVAVATFSPALSLMYQRCAMISKHLIHQKAIVNVKLAGNHVMTVARDRCLNIFDLRVLKTVERLYVTERFQWPKCLAIKDNIVFIGDTDGNVHLVDKSQHFQRFQTIQVSEPNSQIAAICPDQATFVCGGSDRTLRVIAPTKKHFVIKEIAVGHEITSMSSEHEILAIGKTNGYVEVYKPDRNSDESDDE